jgi:mannose-6-phosphate isomerase-like protein (cupin superfamily)
MVELALVNAGGRGVSEDDIERLKRGRRWFDVEGYCVINLGIDDDNTSHDLVVIEACTLHRPHIHRRSKGEFVFVSGRGTITLDQKRLPYNAGDRVTVPNGVAHGFATSTRTVFLSVNNPPISDRDTGESDFHYPEDKQVVE